MGESTPVFGVRNLTLNQYLGSVNSSIDKDSIFGVHKSEEGRIVQCGAIHYGDPVNKCRSANSRGLRNRYYLGAPKHQAQYLGSSKEIVTWTSPYSKLGSTPLGV